MGNYFQKFLIEKGINEKVVKTSYSNEYDYWFVITDKDNRYNFALNSNREWEII